MSLQHPLNTNIFEVITINTPNPGPNVQILHTALPNERLEILSVSFQYIVANAGAARMVMVAGNDGTNDFQHSPLADPVGIANTVTLFFGTNVDARDHEATNNILSGKLSTQLFIEEGGFFVTAVDVWNAADELTGIHIRAKRWITE